MKIFLKIDSVGEVIGDNFTFSANTGAVSPSFANKEALLGGIELEVDSNASSITVSDQAGLNQITQNIDKTVANCVELNITTEPVSVVV